MKGIIFTQFFEMVSEKFSPEMLEKLIDESNLASGGAYTDIGTYDYQELIRLITHLSTETHIPISELEIAYGKYLFRKFVTRYYDLMIMSQSAFDFLSKIDSYIHVEVKKLYPDAELPRFKSVMVRPNKMTMEYHSTRPFADLAEGLISGCIDYFNEKITIERKLLPSGGGAKNVVLFTLTKE